MNATKRKQLEARREVVRAQAQIKATWQKVLRAEIAIGAEQIARMNERIAADPRVG